MCCSERWLCRRHLRATSRGMHPARPAPRREGGPSPATLDGFWLASYCVPRDGDGRAPTLERQVAAAWAVQMNADVAKVTPTIAAVPGYREQFQKVFGGPPTPANIPMALAAYLHTLNSGDSPWDRYEKGQRSAVSADAIEGYALFTGKGRCVVCHTPPVYTDSLFHNVGLELGKATPDPGRFNVTKEAKDRSAFKTPTLRSVAISQPYFHDGGVATLEEAVRYMASGGKADPNKDPLLTPTGRPELD